MALEIEALQCFLRLFRKLDVELVERLDEGRALLKSLLV